MYVVFAGAASMGYLQLVIQGEISHGNGVVWAIGIWEKRRKRTQGLTAQESVGCLPQVSSAWGDRKSLINTTHDVSSAAWQIYNIMPQWYWCCYSHRVSRKTKRSGLFQSINWGVKFNLHLFLLTRHGPLWQTTRPRLPEKVGLFRVSELSLNTGLLYLYATPHRVFLLFLITLSEM